MQTSSFEESVDELKDRVRPQIARARRELGRLNGRITSVIQQHPAACLLGALALGYVVARVARRQTRWL